MATLLLLNKPFNVLSQFSDSDGRCTLKTYIPTSGVYPAGRLDYDSEGLLLLTDDGKLQAQISHPRYKMEKTYWVQVEGNPEEQSLEQLRRGVTLKDGPTRPAKVRKLTPPEIWARNPPIRQRSNDVTQWLEIRISEGRNRQVRRMTAHIGHPTLRLIRRAIGPWQIDGLAPGEFRTVDVHMPNSPTSKSDHSRRKPNSQRHKPQNNTAAKHRGASSKQSNTVSKRNNNNDSGNTQGAAKRTSKHPARSKQQSRRKP